MATVAEVRNRLSRVTFARRLLPELDPWQERVLRANHKRLLLCVARQLGKSSIAAVIATHTAVTKPGSLTLIFSPSERQAKELYAKAQHYFMQLGMDTFESRPESLRKTGLKLASGSRIEALPGTEASVRGFSAPDLVIIDEASRCPDELFYALTPMLLTSAPGARLMLLSTPYGKRGFFFELVEGDRAGEDWFRIRVRADQVERIDAGYLEDERRAMPNAWFRQEYMTEFLEADDAVFTHDAILKGRSEDVEPYPELEVNPIW